MWQRIETYDKEQCPKVVIAWWEPPLYEGASTTYVVAAPAFWHSTRGCFVNTWMAFSKNEPPTHWMSLPDPPTDQPPT